VDREGGLRHGVPGAIASDGGGLEYEFTGRAGNPLRGVVDGVALSDVAHVGAVGAHHGDAGLVSLAMEDAGHGVLTGARG
jgi:hypothetical protein